MTQQEIKGLILDIEYSCGLSDEADWNIDSIDSSKLRGRDSGPGSKVEIWWTMFDDPDYGYVFTLPGPDSGDIYMSGIVHIPSPIGCEKSDCDPEWIHLGKLLTHKELIRVKFI